MTDAEWISELPGLGRIVQDDEIPRSDDAAQAQAERRFDRYVELVTRLTGREGEEALLALLASVHDVFDYGAYEGTYNAIWAFPPELVGRVAGQYLPEWVERFDDEAENVDRMLHPLPATPEALAAFVTAAEHWTPDQQASIARRLTCWIREDPGWADAGRTLGVEIPTPPTDAAPAQWPEEWRQALTTLRSGGSIHWASVKDPTANFPLLFALLDLDHGDQWRETGRLLNPFGTMARRCYPDFVESFRALPPERADRIMTAIRRVRPQFADQLQESLGSADGA